MTATVLTLIAVTVVAMFAIASRLRRSLVVRRAKVANRPSSASRQNQVAPSPSPPTTLLSELMAYRLSGRVPTTIAAMVKEDMLASIMPSILPMLVKDAALTDDERTTMDALSKRFAEAARLSLAASASYDATGEREAQRQLDVVTKELAVIIARATGLPLE